MINLPAMLDIPKKLLPFILQFNNFRFFLLHGGRGGGKTYAIARFLLYLGDKKKLRILCGRETQNSIEASVYTVFVDTIKQFNLDGYKIMANKITHDNGTEIIFKGFKEQGVVNTKGTEGVDILWIDEAEGITKATLDVIIPTIRKNNSKVIFSMNRRSRQDAVYNSYSIDGRCLTIQINYNENRFCPKELKDEALACQARSEEDYRHIWLGQPLSQSENSVFNSNDLANAKRVQFFGDSTTKGRVLSVDVAGGGGDLSVATILDHISPTRFRTHEVITWDEKDGMKNVGRIMSLIAEHSPDVIVVDAIGIGDGVYWRLAELGVNILDFKGSYASESIEAFNLRAEAFFRTRDLIQKNQILLEDDRIINDLEVMKYEFAGSSGCKKIESKAKIKKNIMRSPDFADSFSMAVWGLDKIDLNSHNEEYQDYY